MCKWLNKKFTTLFQCIDETLLWPALDLDLGYLRIHLNSDLETDDKKPRCRCEEMSLIKDKLV